MLAIHKQEGSTLGPLAIGAYLLDEHSCGFNFALACICGHASATNFAQLFMFPRIKKNNGLTKGMCCEVMHPE
jgi:hypothetical protein